MKFTKSPTSGNLTVELEPGNTRFIASQEGEFTQLKKVLVPIDFSDCSKHAVKYAVAFARQFNAEITLLSVIPGANTSFEVGNDEFAALQEKRRQKYEEELAKLAVEHLDKLKYKTVIKTGRPFEEIVKAAKESDQDLIIIATHGYGGSTPLEMGSTSERVIRHARCPVLVVRPIEREFVAPI